MHGDLIAADLLLCWELTVELGTLRDDAGSGRRGALDETVGRFEAALDRAGLSSTGHAVLARITGR